MPGPAHPRRKLAVLGRHGACPHLSSRSRCSKRRLARGHYRMRLSVSCPLHHLHSVHNCCSLGNRSPHGAVPLPLRRSSPPPPLLQQQQQPQRSALVPRCARSWRFLAARRPEVGVGTCPHCRRQRLGTPHKLPREPAAGTAQQQPAQTCLYQRSCSVDHRYERLVERLACQKPRHQVFLHRWVRVAPSGPRKKVPLAE